MNQNNPNADEAFAINQLLSRYCHAMDDERADLCIQLFAETATLDTPVGAVQGKAAIDEWMKGRFKKRPEGYRFGHYLLNPLIAKTDAAHFHVRSMLLYTRQAVQENARPELLSTGIYDDHVQCNDHDYLFISRRFKLTSKLDSIYF